MRQRVSTVIWTVAGCIAAAGAAAAQQLPGNGAPIDKGAQGDVAVTIYNNDLALIQDRRQLNLPRGVSAQEFADVSAAIRPETVTFAADGVSIVEQNFDYDLLSPQRLLQKAVGQDVTLVRTNPATGAETSETARVLANNGGIVVQIGRRIEVLNPGQQRIVFPALPAGLRARPTLSVTLDADSAGTRPGTLTYLSRGFGWKADYVALFDEQAGKIDVQGWVTLTNNSGTSFVDARTLLVAGAVGEAQPVRRYSRPPSPPPPPPGNRPGTETADRERLGDFYVYPIAGRTTIAQAQQKQVSFLDVAGAPAAKAYYFRNDWLGSSDDARSVDTVLRFSTSRQGGLGDALPAGTVRVYMRDQRGAPQFIGENGIGHTPMGSALALKTGEAFDVKVKPTVETRERIGRDRWRTTMRYTLTNARAQASVVELEQAGLDSYWDDSRILSESQKSERVDADRVRWRVEVPANGEASVTATFDTRF
ncbi:MULTISPECIES: DUF4139 domain-containing protein [unclassified Sphingomonas]|uniref:DUF4139 domain-containing protein n=1 Tax=unclassified Sphingomonas TaxID=196159 RepID=UPI00082AF50E|nr:MULTISPECIES: DUF4139 domain-containing protein [unclassified Sphingomonas]